MYILWKSWMYSIIVNVYNLQNTLPMLLTILGIPKFMGELKDAGLEDFSTQIW